MKIRLEYVWLDGYKPESNLRSKVKIVDFESVKEQLRDGKTAIGMWNFDGSSTNQAETGSSDCILNPVRIYTRKMFPLENSTVYVLCEVLNPDGTPHKTNERSKIGEEFSDLWFGFEQEYFIMEKPSGDVLGHNRRFLQGQGKYYCGVGSNVVGRDLVEEHTDMCLDYSINITGTNAEVALGQWEYQVFSKGKLEGGDDLWMSRYFLHKVSEKYGYEINLHPKPIRVGEWNGSGLHTNFSTDIMRDESNERYFMSLFSAFETRHDEHINAYGSDNQLRLTGKFETQSIDKFSWGVSDRGASIRVPQDTANEWKGYVEDRRPGSNADPYKIIQEIVKSLKLTEQIYHTKHMMTSFVDMDGLTAKYGTISNDDLLNEYRNDDDSIESKTNTESEVMKFDTESLIKSSSLPEALKRIMLDADKVEIKPNEK
jgi:glutamine synthetase